MTVSDPNVSRVLSINQRTRKIKEHWRHFRGDGEGELVVVICGGGGGGGGEFTCI